MENWNELENLVSQGVLHTRLLMSLIKPRINVIAGRVPGNKPATTSVIIFINTTLELLLLRDLLDTKQQFDIFKQISKIIKLIKFILFYF